MEAVEKKQYGWFWVCPNGGKDCHYRHALPPGYVLKSQMKALLAEESEKLPIEEEIEKEVRIYACCAVIQITSLSLVLRISIVIILVHPPFE